MNINEYMDSSYQASKLMNAAPKLISSSISTQAEFITDWGSYVYMVGGIKYRKTIHDLIEALLKNAERDCDDTGIDFLRDLVNELNTQTGRTK